MTDTRLIRYHLRMLSDRRRMEGFRQAIAAVVSEGDVVLDLGCGTGVLSFFACQAGARHVYAVDDGVIAHLARDLAQRNGLADRVTILAGHSSDIEVPEPVDVILSETLWNFGLGEGILATVGEAADRWLKPSGRVVPASFEMRLGPAGYGPATWLSHFDEGPYGLDFSRLRTAAANTPHAIDPDPGRALGPYATVGRFDLPYDGPDRIDLTATLDIETAGRLDALHGGFRSELGGGAVVSSLPPERAESWSGALFPLDAEVEVEPGDRVAVQLTTHARNEHIWTWDWRVERGAEVRAAGRQSTARAMFHLGAVAR